jgi:tol-pal system protein YbgF
MESGMYFRIIMVMFFIILLCFGVSYSQDELRNNDTAEDETGMGTDHYDNERSHYDRALSHYFAQQPLQARDEFKKFMDIYPQSPLVPNARYWLAETYYMEDDYPRAILTFRRLLEQFPDDPKASDALLKIGYSYERLNDLPNSLFYLDILIQDYPGSAAALRASDKIKELRSRE